MAQFARGSRGAPIPCGCGCDGSAAWLPRSLVEFSGFGIAFARGLLSGESYDLRRFTLSALQGGATMSAAIAASGLISDRSRWQEVANKVTAYRLFVSADRF